MDLRKIRRKRAFWWTAFGLWLVLAVYLSSQNGSGSSDVSGWLATKLWRVSNALTKVLLDRGISYATFHFCVRKLAHFTVHLVLAFVTMRASAWSFPRREEATHFTVVLALFMAIFDELIQLVAPGRSSVALDGVINLGGAVVGLLVSSRLGPNKPTKTS